MTERSAVVQQTFRRYQKADRRHKGRILDEFVQLTGYSRTCAALVLRQWETVRWLVGPRGPLRLVAREQDLHLVVLRPKTFPKWGY